MTSPRQNDIPDRAPNADETLRLIATLPAPDGLADRVQARLAAAPRRPFLLSSFGFSRNGWMFSPVLRGCAAAAIVVLVAGGGFTIYSRVQPAPTAKVMEMPTRIGPNGGFSNAGAMRTPDTLNGPVLKEPALKNPALATPAAPAQQNVIAPMPSSQPQTLAPKAAPSSHKKKAAAIR
ncbi:hypothetical protein [Occallatibacter riparius]|uniref:Uncharacterized protein n=1 Tax=Occallatibacter riparius TaxID=1002689 RepID=A0A9J7BMS1_9BACT|nr:hypothetical protein [Occallatibacter riparius]UWZ84180.1 hypothetical protein MOP44_26960 [Occallatibacter riparius]